MQIYCFNRLDFRIWSRIWFSELFNFSCCSSVPRQRLGDFGNLGSSNDPATKFHTSLGKITYLRLISQSLSSSVLCNPFELFFLFSSAWYRSQSPGVNTHICALHSLSHRDPHKLSLQSFDCTFAVPALILPSRQIELNAPVPTQPFLSAHKHLGTFRYVNRATQVQTSILNSIKWVF